LADGPLSVGQLAATLPVTRSAVSQHLQVLKHAGLVSEQASGTKRIYRLNPSAVAALRDQLDHLYRRCLDSYAGTEGRAIREGVTISRKQDPVVIDGGDRTCVSLLLELRTRVDGLPGGTTIHLIATDPAAPIDLPAWCHLTGHAYLGPVITGARPTYAIHIASNPAATRPSSPWRLQS
jgi:tRNA 2-thiouridine synthesizing protein A